ncbi:MAG: glycosyltransferase family 2 protein, partial [Rubrivivax sp.]
HGQPLSARAQMPGEIFAPCAAAALYRTEVLRELGGFDESYFCYMEDLDLGFRVRLRGHTIRYVPDAVVHHVGSVSSGGRLSDFAVYHGHRNAVWTFVKNMPGALFWLALPLHLAANLAMVLRFVRLGQGRVILRAKRDALRGLRRVWSERRAVQGAREASVTQIWRVLHVSFEGYRS